MSELDLKKENDGKKANILKIIYDKYLSETNKIIYDGNSFYIYNDTFYKFYSVNEIKKNIKYFLDNNFPNHLHPKLIDNIVNLLEIEFIVEIDQINSSKYLNFLDGVLILETNKLIPHSENLIFTYVQPLKYKDKIEPKSILEFINHCVSGSKTDADKLLSIAYCLLMNITKYEVFLEIVGSGSTGKSTYINLLRAYLQRIYLQGLFEEEF